MQFQILDNENNPVTLEEIDRIACNVWKKEYSSKMYATPSKGRQNWYDCIGFAIATQTNWFSHGVNTWATVLHEIFMSVSISSIKEDKNGELKIEQNNEDWKSSYNYTEPYKNLINEFIKRGFKPQKVE